MFSSIRRLLHRGRGEPGPAPRPPAPEEDRSTGEDVVEGHQAYAEEAAAPGTPRLKTRNL